MLLSVGERALASLSVDDFLWRNPPRESSIQSTLGPRAEELGPVDDLHADLVRLATLVYLVDRTVPRGRGVRRGNRWRRDLELAVPVSDAEPWTLYAEGARGATRLPDGRQLAACLRASSVAAPPATHRCRQRRSCPAVQRWRRLAGGCTAARRPLK
jgi:hypothetical protein